MTDLCVRLATADDRPVVARLWLMYRHDMSELDGVLPHPDGTFRSDRLDAAFTSTDWAPYLVSLRDRPVGFAFVRGLETSTRVMNSFFVARGTRRTGIGARAARRVVARHPGPWEVAFQSANTSAVRFWRHVATRIAGDAWTEEGRPVPGRPELPPDSWITFHSPDGAPDEHDEPDHHDRAERRHR